LSPNRAHFPTRRSSDLSRIDAPTAAVLRAFSEPERTAEFSGIVRYSKLLGSEDNRKVVEFEMVVLGQPQRFTLEFTFLPEEKRVDRKSTRLNSSHQIIS